MTEPITSPTNPRVKRVARLRDRRARDEAGAFVVEGERDVSRAFAAGLNCLDLFATDGRPDATPVSESAMAKMSYRQSPTHLLGVFETPRRTLADVPQPGEHDLILVAVGTEKPGNLGAMARTAAAAGCSALIAAGSNVDVWNPNAIRNSGGAIFSLPTIPATDDEALAWIADMGLPTLATIAEGGEDLWHADVPTGPLAVVIGPEHAGLDARWTEAATRRVTVPTHDADGAVDSLNASVTSAVVLFELDGRRRRT